MGIRNAVLRASVGAGVLSMALSAGAAVTPQNAVLTAAVTPPASIRFGGTASYVVDITNTGPNHATEVALSKIVLPAAPASTGTLKIAGVDGATCDTDANGFVIVDTAGVIQGLDAKGKPTGAKPCPIIADFTNDPGTGATPANVAEVTITVEWAVPTDADGKLVPPVTAACPAANSMGDIAIEISATSTPTTTPVTLPGAAVEVKQWADVAITLAGPSSGKTGDLAKFTHTVTNRGPCPATNVIASFFPNINVSTMLTFDAASATGPCASADPINDAICPLGDIAPGASVTWTYSFKLGNLPESVTQTTIPYEFDAYSFAAGKEPPFSSAKRGVADPDLDNNDANAAGIRIGKEGGGCSSGGPGGLFAVALMAAAVFAARRRRTA
ncbi:MYXO-CTERM sorting domain-containing protein [Anaeromyxobacter diazotrophicus]|uniref:DUF11 domain-containing protein n=1 Tax=Anaeromyxobacter diazotrophicus TaxID=2590199 RepID=A0A7I9VU77_9BACT|nr:MYXO-CTERM sorting domain-containing protein [Anaeromyxobacter diazotrophicus]GEJ59517.1 hypothetical protein AMYX_42580 [Anaeromyxobacter diazotrophicus]